MDYNAYPCDCGGTMVPILYGWPSAEMIEHARGGIIALGGPKSKLYTHYCYTCNEIFKKEGTRA